MPPSAPSTRDGLVAVVPAWIALAAFVASALLLSHRALERRAVGERTTAERWAMTDFRDTVYYPAVALAAGGNPWEARFAEDYPVQRPLPPYGPVVVLAHLPLVLLPVRAAEAAYFLLTIALTAASARLALRAAGLGHDAAPTLALATALLLSRPGQQNLLLGQCTLEVVLGCWIAWLHARDRPWLGALGIVVASMKPQFAIPLVLVLLARGDARAALAGIAATGVISIGTLLVAGGLAGPGTWLAAIARSSATVADAALVWPRIDAGFLARHVLGLPERAELLAGAALLVLGLVACRRARAGTGGTADRGLAVALACLTILVPLYHIAYDALLLVLPVTMLLATRSAPAWRTDARRHATLVALLLVPFANYVATNGVVARLPAYGPAWRVVIALNATALFAALLVAAGMAFWSRPRA